MSNKLKVGVIGIGGISNNNHIPAWLSHPETEIIALCDIEREKADKVAQDYKIPHVFTDFHDLLANDEIDIIDICTPNLFHSEIAVAALQHGKHVFCEKPDAINPEEAQKMADATKNSEKQLMVMRNNRFNPSSTWMKQFVDDGLMGEIYTGRCGWIRRRGIPGKGGWFTNKKLSGGGPLIDLGVHFIDLAMWLMGNPRPVSVTGATYNKFANTTIDDSPHSQFGEAKKDGVFDVEDLATGFIRFDNGATLQIEFSWASNIEEERNFYELRGTKAGVSCKNGDLKVFTETANALSDVSPRLQQSKQKDHETNIYHFIDVVQNRAEPIITPEQGVDMIKILAAIYESAQTGSEVKL
ncbi:Gfo/Idh/MocA family protein [Radiobacillus sp. PE A8.2]|uniref:Gfo/Idh/MocA family protein n=1 Tax=Radiobacillus sp. PE A8.2 TaxID=3380349 RepID=UPI00389022E2